MWGEVESERRGEKEGKGERTDGEMQEQGRIRWSSTSSVT
jgi:hypothetical protein